MLALLVAALVTLPACGRSVLVHRPADPAVDRAVTEMWTAELERVAQDGDWFLVRSYSGPGDWIVTLTSGEEISHAAIYDARRRTVVEALLPAVQEIPLDKFVHRNRYLIVVRPPGTPEERAAAVARARSMVGTGFDLRGMLGWDRPGNFYCSELVYWASGASKRAARPWIIVPNKLIELGQVVYFSGRRDDAQLARAARGWLDEHRVERVVSSARY